jgi:hypothetical protein
MEQEPEAADRPVRSISGSRSRCEKIDRRSIPPDTSTQVDLLTADTLTDGRNRGSVRPAARRDCRA